MSSVHFLNVDPGDCSIIRHAGDRVSVIDICGGNYKKKVESYSSTTTLLGSFIETMDKSTNGNFRMKERLTNPIDYMQSQEIGSVFRFILSHPDMDHMDGLAELESKIGVANFWDAGVKRKKPDFSGGGYKEEDWQQYEAFCAGKGVKTIRYLAGANFKFANRNEEDASGGDGLYILAPDEDLVKAANETEDPNDGSFVILYRSVGGRILFPGDAHDATWEYVLKNNLDDVANCSVMIAPHHGRHSDRSFDFLDLIEPKFTLFGNAPSEHLAYDEWNKRGLPFITSNQAGNIVLENEAGVIKVFIENASFAETSGKDCSCKNQQGYILYETISETTEVKSGAQKTYQRTTQQQTILARIMNN